MHVGGVQGDEHRVEIEPPHRLEQDLGIVVPRDAEVPHAPFVAGLKQRFERPALAEDAVEITPRPQIMELPEIEPISPQPAQAIVEQPQRTVAGAVVRLRGQEDLIAAISEGRAVVVHAAVICRSGVAVIDAQIERPVDHGDRLARAVPSTEHSLAVDAEQRDLPPGAAERAARKRDGGSWFRHADGSADRDVVDDRGQVQANRQRKTGTRTVSPPAVSSAWNPL